MSEEDRRRWDRRYAASGPAPGGDHGPPPALVAGAAHLPVAGTALELACGRGRAAVWLAHRGLDVHAIDVSPVAIEYARALAEDEGVAGRCHFEVADLDHGLPDGPLVDLVLCHLFRDARLDRAMIDRLKPGGVLAASVLSEVGAGPGPYRAAPGALRAAFADLHIIAAGEGEGATWLVAVKDESH